MNKKVLCGILGLTLSLSLVRSTSSLAITSDKLNTTMTPNSNVVVQENGDYYYGYCWDLDHINKDVRDVHQGSWNYMGDYTATRNGEVYSVSYSHSYENNFTGSLSVSKGVVEGQLGYTFGVSTSFQESVYSSSLTAGETVKAYWIKSYSQSDIYQNEYYFEMHNGVYTRYDYVGNKVAYGNKAIMPNFRLDYYNASGSKISAVAEDTKPFKSEIYTADSNGKYYLSEVINYSPDK